MSLEAVQALLRKQKLIEGMVHNQNMARRDIVETLVHRQHVAELEGLMAQLPAAEIGGILQSLTAEEARFLWARVPETRVPEVLWEIPDDLREALTGHREPEFLATQVFAYELIDGRMQAMDRATCKDFANRKPVWIDLVNASATERLAISEHFAVTLPDPGESIDLEVSSRFHVEDNDAIRLHSNFLLDRAGSSRSVPVAFVLHEGVLFSLRNEDLPVFRLLPRRAQSRPGYVEDACDLLVDLYGADVEYSADSLEDIYATLGRIGKHVLSQTMSDRDASAVLAEIAEEEDLNGRIRANILDTQRALAFLMQCKVLGKAHVNDAKQILRNIESLNSHTAFLFDKINFLMDATIGFININQNRRVSQLTVFGVVFMPINILAGIGGMSEFSMMTRGVAWPVAYGALAAGMILLGWGTYVALKFAEIRRTRRAQQMSG
ncbi:MAG: magnesium transporter CorA [Betaproteobacteria bacterium]|nr:magnesium transporter CorA [Betaproteobacteria bacterium]